MEREMIAHEQAKAEVSHTLSSFLSRTIVVFFASLNVVPCSFLHRIFVLAPVSLECWLFPLSLSLISPLSFSLVPVFLLLPLRLLLPHAVQYAVAFAIASVCAQLHYLSLVEQF